MDLIRLYKNDKTFFLSKFRSAFLSVHFYLYRDVKETGYLWNYNNHTQSVNVLDADVAGASHLNAVKCILLNHTV